MRKISAFRAGVVLARMRVRRFQSQVSGRAARIGERLGTRPRARSMFLTPVLVMVLSATLVGWGWSTAHYMLKALDKRAYGLVPTLSPITGADGVAGVVFAILGVMLVVLFAAQVTQLLANRDVGSADWDVEWLVTLPIPRATITFAKVVELALTSWTTWTMGLGLLAGVALKLGGFVRALAVIPIGLAMLALTSAAVALAVETAMRLQLRTSTRQNVQAANSVLAMLLLVPMFTSSNSAAVYVHASDILVKAPLTTIAALMPGTLLVRALLVEDLAPAAASFALFFAECAILLLAAVVASNRLIRAGLVASGNRIGVRSHGPLVARALRSRTWLTPIQRRDLRLLLRDRNLMVQLVVLPLLIVLQQMYTSGFKIPKPAYLGAYVFGAGAYALAFSGLQLLVPDGRALWLTLAQPISVERLLREKVVLSLGFACVIGGIVATLSLSRLPIVSFEHVATLILAFTGIVIYSAIAGALGVFAYDANVVDVRRRIKQQFMMLYLGLTSFFVYAIVAESFWQQLVLVVLSVFLAIALWQKARDLLPYFFDPSSAPELPIAVSDGVMALMAYFVMQGLFALLFALLKAPAYAVPLLASAHAALVVFVSAYVVLGKKRRAGMPRLRAGGIYVFLGFAGGAFLGAGASLYASYAVKWFEIDPSSAEALNWYYALLAVIVAPCVEEYLFRGILLTGLKRALTPALAVLASAALFAVVHPPASVPPVFLLGLACAGLAVTTRSLLPGIALHFAYNGTIVWLATATRI